MSKSDNFTFQFFEIFFILIIMRKLNSYYGVL